MSSSDYVFDASEATFDSDVVLRSHDVPVIVDFWAPWCGPCRALGPMLERLTEEADGAFLLAKVNVDENPNLSVQFKVQGIPAVKAFKDATLIDGFVGVLPEPKLREFLRKIAPTEADLALERGLSLASTRHWADAETEFLTVLDSQPDNPKATLGIVRCLVALGRGDAALAYIENFPGGSEIVQAQQLAPLARLIASVEGVPDYSTIESETDALYDQAAKLLMQGKWAAGMDGLLDVLRKDKRYRKGQPREVMLGVFALLGDDDPMTREYRNELASVLF